VLIAADTEADPEKPWASFLSHHAGIIRLGNDNQWTLFQLPLRRPWRGHCSEHPVAITAVEDRQGRVDAAILTDHDPTTRWTTSHGQRPDDVLVLDLGHAERLCALVMSLGAEAGFYPRTLRVATTVDNVTWQTGFFGKMGGAAFLAALENPRDARISIPLQGKAARFVRLWTAQPEPLYPWVVADIVVRAEQ
jgi:hypothetical protein